MRALQKFFVRVSLASPMVSDPIEHLDDALTLARELHEGYALMRHPCTVFVYFGLRPIIEITN